MATCGHCGETIVFGGVRAGDLRYCNNTCLENAGGLGAAAPVSDDAVADLAHRIHSGPCPKCQRTGPVDVHMAYWVWSALAFTRWGHQQQLSCRRCALKTQAGRLVQSAVLGWWGFPWGIIMTPVQVVRTATAMIAPPRSGQPSVGLHSLARTHLMFQAQSSAAAPRPRFTLEP